MFYVPTENSERSDRLLRAIRNLENTDKTIITLHLEGFKNPEVAKMIGIRQNHVAVKLHRIRQQLKEMLQATTS